MKKEKMEQQTEGQEEKKVKTEGKQEEKNDQGCHKSQKFEMLMIFKPTFCLTSVVSKRCL